MAGDREGVGQSKKCLWRRDNFEVVAGSSGGDYSCRLARSVAQPG